MDIQITKRNGTTEDFNKTKITNNVKRACKNIDDVDVDTIIQNASIKLFNGVTTREIDAALIKSARALFEIHPNYSDVASRLLSSVIYKDYINNAHDIDSTFDYNKRGASKEKLVNKAFALNLQKLRDADIVNAMLNDTHFDIYLLSQNIDSERDSLLPYAGAQTLADRYLHKINGVYHETIQTLWMRVAMGLALGECALDDTSVAAIEKRTQRALEFYEIISTLCYMPSTPTLFNSGNVRNQLSSCFLSTFEDSLEGIFDGVHQQAQLSKYAGGLGMDFTNFRVAGQHIKSMNGKTQGAIYFWKLFNDMLVAVNQSGKRRGAGAGYLEPWHGEFRDFCQLRKNVGDERRRTHDMNIAAWIPDLFMEKVLKDEPWYLFSPDEVPNLHETYGDKFRKEYEKAVERGKRGELQFFEEVSAKDTWKYHLKQLFETGGPWITFKDPCNIRYTNDHEGVVHSSNLCLVGDTEVEAIVDGQQMSINLEELNELVKEGKQCLVYSYNVETDIYEYKEVEASALTCKDAELYEIEDESGNRIQCTGDHKVWTKNRGYVAAKDLRCEDELLINS